jgi:hypothetical protein
MEISHVIKTELPDRYGAVDFLLIQVAAFAPRSL